MADGAGESRIVATYRARTKSAAELNRKAQEVLPGGIVHDSRRMSPYGIYGDHALGSRKWDIDGNEYVDMLNGFGVTMFGHAPDFVSQAIGEQLKICLKKILRVAVVLLVKGTIGHLVVNIFKLFAGFIVRNYVFKKLVGIVILLFDIVFFSHA